MRSQPGPYFATAHRVAVHAEDIEELPSLTGLLTSWPAEPVVSSPRRREATANAAPMPPLRFSLWDDTLPSSLDTTSRPSPFVKRCRAWTRARWPSRRCSGTSSAPAFGAERAPRRAGTTLAVLRARAAPAQNKPKGQKRSKERGSATDHKKNPGKRASQGGS